MKKVSLILVLALFLIIPLSSRAASLESAASFFDNLVNYLALPAALVAPEVSLPPLSVTLPAAEVVWQRGSEQGISWQKGVLPASASVAIYLVDPLTQKTARVLAARTANDGTTRVVIPGNLKPGNYRLRLSAKVSGHIYESYSKHLVVIAENIGINLLGPRGGTLLAGASLPVSWQASGVSADRRVIIQLSPVNEVGAPIIFGNSLNDGRELVTIPPATPPGAYWLEVVTSANGTIYTSRSRTVILVISSRL